MGSGANPKGDWWCKGEGCTRCRRKRRCLSVKRAKILSARRPTCGTTRRCVVVVKQVSSQEKCVCVWPRVRQVVHRKTQKEMCKGPGQRGRGGEKAKGIQGGNKGVRVRSTNGKNKLLEA